MYYFLHQLIERTIANKNYEFLNFVEKIRICLSFYFTLDYACNHVGERAKKVMQKTQSELNYQTDLFSG